MRLNTEENPEIANKYRITVNGNRVLFCKTVDTDEGYAICLFAVNTKRGSIYPLSSYDTDNPYDQHGVIHEYTLHNFELWDATTNELVVKV